MSGILKDLHGGKIAMVMGMALVVCAAAFWWTKDNPEEPAAGPDVVDVDPVSVAVSDESGLEAPSAIESPTPLADDGFAPVRVARPSLDGHVLADGPGVASENESELRAIPQSEPSLDGGGPPSFESPGSIPSEPELPVQVVGQESETAADTAAPSQPLTHPLANGSRPGFEKPVDVEADSVSTVEIPSTPPQQPELSPQPGQPTAVRADEEEDSFPVRGANSQGGAGLASPVESFGPRTLEPAGPLQPIVSEPDSSHPLATGKTGPSSASDQVHSVRAGDSYWTISRQHYGTARYFQALSAYNKTRVRNPLQMRPGMKVLVPSRELLESHFASLVPTAAGAARTIGFQVDANGHPIYAVGADDTLTGIARAHLGRTSRWIQIYRMNRDQLPSPHKLKLGMILRMPADAIRSQDGFR